MGRFSYDKADNYGGQGGGGFFRLQNDKDVAQVRFLYSGIDDVEGIAVHQVPVGDRNRYVNCIREYNEPKDVCPFCADGKPQYAKLFIPVYNVKEDKVQIWERGKTYFAKLSGLCSRYKNLVSHIFEIERHGKTGSQTTRYEIYEVDDDDTTLDDFKDEIPDVLGGLVLDKTADEMAYYLDEGQFPPDDEEDEEKPVRRRGSRNRDEDQDEEKPTRRGSRRTPANSRRGEEF